MHGIEILEAAHAHHGCQQLGQVRMVIDADETGARAECEETFRAARCERHNLVRPGAQRERSGQIVHGEARSQVQRGSSRGAARPGAA